MPSLVDHVIKCISHYYCQINTYLHVQCVCVYVCVFVCGVLGGHLHIGFVSVRDDDTSSFAPRNHVPTRVQEHARHGQETPDHTQGQERERGGVGEQGREALRLNNVGRVGAEYKGGAE